MRVIPLSLGAPPRDHLGRVKTLHEANLAAGYGEVYLPDAPARKYPGAPRQWAWQYVYPSRTRSVDPRSGVVRRHHADEKTLQRAMQQAIRSVAYGAWPAWRCLRGKKAVGLVGFLGRPGVTATSRTSSSAPDDGQSGAACYAPKKRSLTKGFLVDDKDQADQQHRHKRSEAREPPGRRIEPQLHPAADAHE
jgi:hypothetical protein